MDYSKRWQIIRELGQGGQGKVYRVIDTVRFHTTVNLQGILQASINKFSNKFKPATDSTKEEALELFRTAVLQIIQMEDVTNHAALKVLLEPEEARDSNLAEERIKREIKAMSEIKHPNLLRILDFDPDSKWFVSQFHIKGSLNKNTLFVGDFPKALRAFSRLVEGVSEIHKKRMVHRDIKPQNVFIDCDNNLILGDFGLVFFTDETHARLSATYENVGSRDWMPTWAYGIRVEDLKPSFDIFCLGKTLWSMVSGKPILPLWYLNKDEFNLEKIFPDARYMNLANRLLKKCIVEEEKDCLPDAMALLEEIKQTLTVIDSNADLIDPHVRRRCKVCAIGNYMPVVNRNLSGSRNFGLNPTGSKNFNIFACNHCGHVELFFFDEGKKLPAWGEK